jgi:hypothetical protein
VKVADGAVICCESQFLNARWEVQGYHFISNDKVLHLHHFNMILSYDWLERFSPMRLHWLEKWIAIPYGDTTVVLHGMLPDQSSVYHISSIQDSEVEAVAQSYLDNDDVTETPQVPSEVQHLLSLFTNIFATQIPTLPSGIVSTPFL